MTQKQVVFDATLFTSLQSCPQYMDYRFNQLWQTLKSNSVECGSLAHTILEFFYKAKIQGKSRNESIAIGIAAGLEYVVPFSEDNKYVKETDHKGLLNTPEASEGNLIGWTYVFDTMNQYFDFYKNESWTPIAVEEVRGKVIYETPELQIVWKAKYDLIVDTNAGLVSVDHKTMKQRKDTISLNNQFKGQATILGSKNVIIDKIGWQKSLKPEEKFTRPGISYSADSLAEFANDIVPYYANMLIAYVEAGHYPRNYTNCESKYGYCDFKMICELDRNSRDQALPIHFFKGKVWDISND